MKSKILKGLKYTVYTVLLIIIAFNCYSLASRFIFKNKVVNIFGYSYLFVKSDSMLDYMKEGNLIIIKLNDSYKVGDVITFDEDGLLITHRIVSIDGDKIITKGDVNNKNDSPIEKKDVIGVVKKVI